MDKEQIISDANEFGYEAGCRATWLNLLSMAIHNLGNKTPDYVNLIAEREAAVAALRRVCSDYGDNDWPNDLHITDVIEKHLERHLP